ncbi:ORF1 [Picobirnavirus Equ3]|uniref:ORF1 n=1 Tax=Picobirnavirus Equ3 TaxID=1673646 RepID=A0A0H4ATH8_9VIRU|nr:ORF1 [Picobirnavirus Equ3]AKN50625.1 ORF1 [Picobirnavirus Equ3]
MTQNQIAFRNAKENERHNLATEAENTRHNSQTEAAQWQSNVLADQHYQRQDKIAVYNAREAQRHNAAMEAETNRSNTEREADTDAARNQGWYSIGLGAAGAAVGGAATAIAKGLMNNKHKNNKNGGSNGGNSSGGEYQGTDPHARTKSSPTDYGVPLAEYPSLPNDGWAYNPAGAGTAESSVQSGINNARALEQGWITTALGALAAYGVREAEIKREVSDALSKIPAPEPNAGWVTIGSLPMMPGIGVPLF